jgi:hypothetical protein
LLKVSVVAANYLADPVLRDAKAFSDDYRACLDEFCNGHIRMFGQIEEVIVKGHAWGSLIDLFDEVPGSYRRPV